MRPPLGLFLRPGMTGDGLRPCQANDHTTDDLCGSHLSKSFSQYGLQLAHANPREYPSYYC